MRLQSICPTFPVFVLPPSWAIEALVQLGTPAKLVVPLQWPEPAKACSVPILDQNHWSLLVLTCAEGKLQGEHFDAIPGRSSDAALRVAGHFARLVGMPLVELQHKAIWLQTDGTSCGILTLAHAAAFLFQEPCDAILEDARSFLTLIPAHVGSFCGSGGLSESQFDAVKAILVERGVPADKVVDRLNAAIAKIGAGPIAQALCAANHWQALKAAGSTQAASFRWIRPEELKAYAEQKAQQKFGTAVKQPRAKKEKVKRRQARPELQVDPQSLQLAPNTFTAEGGTPLAQLSFAEVSSQAQGIAFCTAQQLLMFACPHQRLSVDALALVSTSELPPGACEGAPVTSVKFPVIYEPTKEAILLQGSLLQLGDETVQLVSPDIADIERVDTLTGRISLYRDETAISWDEVVAAPVRAVLQHVPALALCKNTACKGDCPHFHPAVDEVVEHMLLDVWARRFSKADGSRVAAGQADLFQALVRVPCSALKHLQRANISGFYFEPRSGDGHTAHPGFAVIWMPGKNRQQAMHIVQTFDKAVALTRINNRYGVRVRDTDEHAAHLCLRPEVDFVRVRIAARYKLHPLPHGLQRKHLATLLKQWNWPARPLQVLKGDSAGCAWEVGSDQEPPGQALAAAGSYVLVTKIRDASSQSKPQAVTASARTRKHILYDDPEQSQPTSVAADPWLHGKDPWSLSKPPGLPAPPVPSASTAETKLTKVKSELEEAFRQRLEEHTAKHWASQSQVSDNQECRLQKLEVGMQELQAQNNKLQDWCQNVGNQVSAHTSHIAEIKNAVSAQQTEVGQLRTEFTQTLSNSVACLQKDMTQQLASQMQQIESLLNKKARTE